MKKLKKSAVTAILLTSVALVAAPVYASWNSISHPAPAPIVDTWDHGARDDGYEWSNYYVESPANVGSMTWLRSKNSPYEEVASDAQRYGWASASAWRQWNDWNGFNHAWDTFNF